MVGAKASKKNSKPREYRGLYGLVKKSNPNVFAIKIQAQPIKFCLVSCACFVFSLLIPAFISIPYSLFPESAAVESLSETYNTNGTLSMTATEKINLTANNPTPTGEFVSTNAQINIQTDNYTGYTLSVAAKNNTTLKHSNLDNSIQTLGGNVQESNFTADRWGYSTDNTTYKPISTTSELIKATSAPSTESLPVKFAAKPTTNNPSGKYTGSVIFSGVMNYVPLYTVTWNPNGGSVSPTTSQVSAGSPIGTMPTPTSSGNLQFAGWYTDATDGTEITNDTIVTDNVTYYAHWRNPFDQAFAEAGKSKATASDGRQYYKMQDMTSSICNAVDPADFITGTLVDTRDGNTYNVVKLQTGQCWMQQNLRLGKSGTSYTLDSTNSNLPSGTTFTLGSADVSSDYTNWRCTNDSDCKTSRVLASDSTEYGNYYTWYTATANTGTYSMSSGNVTGSICPKGWRLPTSDDSGEFETLHSIYNSGSTSSDAGLIASPLNLVRAGYYNVTIDYQGSKGDYWSSTADTDAYAYILDFYSTFADPSVVDQKFSGNSVRCISQGALTTYTLNYNANGGSNAPATQSVSIDYAPTITLSSDTPTPPSGSGKTFVGWATSSTATAAEYQPGASYTFTSTQPVTLYAVWLQAKSFDQAFAEAGKSKATASDGKQYYKMQDMTSSICNAVDPADVITGTLVDSRDGNTYNVVKLQTGQCWMQQNLRLGKSGTSYTLDSTNSDLPSGTTFTLGSAQTSGTTDWDCSSNSACKTSRVYATNNTEYGNYYIWYTATANTGTYSMSSGNATGSICPKGWRLPTGSSGEFKTLNNTYNSGSTSSDAGLIASPLNLVRAGYYYNNGAMYDGSYGYYWSSSVQTDSVAYNLYFGKDRAYPVNNKEKYSGGSVRCITSD